jgi:SCP-2 sterol transfer family
VSADSPIPTTPNPTMEQTNAGTAGEIEAFFNTVAAGGQQPRLRSVTGACQFNITGVGSWLVTLKGGVPTVVRDGTQATTPDVVFTTSPEVFSRLMHREGHLNVLAAALQGLIVVTGDTALAATVVDGYIPQMAGSQPR